MKKRYIRIILLILIYVFDYLLGLIGKINRKKYKKFIFKVIIYIFSDKVYESRQYYDVIEKRIVSQVILSLPSFGCSHYFKRGGCGMCAFNQEIERYRLRYLDPGALVLLVKWFFSGLTYYIEKNIKEAEVLTIFMAGSFLNKDELPIKSQDFIFSYFIGSKLIKLIFESRPEYIIREKSRVEKYAAEAINNRKKIGIVIGLESSDDLIRNKFIGKGVTKKLYSRAIAIVNSLGAISNTYILIGAPFLNRQEMVSKAVDSVKYAWGQKSTLVSLEANFVQAGTRWAELYKQGKLRVPKLWDIVEVIEKINSISSNWYLGEFSDWPEPIVSPRNCPLCTEQVLRAFSFLRKNHSISVLKNLKCFCRGTDNNASLRGGINHEL